MYAVQRFYLKPSEVQKEQISAKMHCIPFVMPKKKKKKIIEDSQFSSHLH